MKSSGLQPIIRYLDHRFAPIEHPTSNVRILHRPRIVHPQRSLDDAEHPSRACIDRRLSLIASGFTRRYHRLQCQMSHFSLMSDRRKSKGTFVSLWQISRTDCQLDPGCIATTPSMASTLSWSAPLTVDRSQVRN